MIKVHEWKKQKGHFPSGKGKRRQKEWAGAASAFCIQCLQHQAKQMNALIEGSFQF